MATKPTFPQLRSFDSDRAAHFAVGANFEFLRTLHDRQIAIACSEDFISRAERVAAGELAASIREHVQWLNEQTAQLDAKILGQNPEAA